MCRCVLVNMFNTLCSFYIIMKDAARFPSVWVTGGTRRVMTWTVRSMILNEKHTSTFTAPSAARTTTATKTSCLARRRSTRHHSSRRHRRQVLQVSQFAALFVITVTAINVTHHWFKSILLNVLLLLNFPNCFNSPKFTF